MKHPLSTFLISLLSTTLMAQKQFTLDDLIPGGSTYFQTSYPENKYYAWWGEVCVELSTDECNFIDCSTRKKISTLTLNNVNSILTDSGRKAIQHFYDAEFPFGDKPCMLVRSGNQTTLINWETKNVVWKTDTKGSNTDWNPQTMATAYVKDSNLFVEDAKGSTFQLSKDGSIDIRYGESVHRNEFGIEKGTFWNPQGTKLAFYRMDQSEVSKYPQVNITPFDASQVYEGKDSASLNYTRCATHEPDPYPMAGEKSHKVTIGVFDLNNGSTVYLKTGDPTDRYFTNITWSPDGSKIYLIELNRDQNHGSLDEYDATTGNKLRTLFTESNDKYYEPMQPIHFLPWDAKQFIYQTRHDGYNHIYLYNIDKVNGASSEATPHKQLTSGKFEVIEMLGFNLATKSIIFTSNEKNPIQNNVFAVNMYGKRKLIGDGTGWHNATLSEKGTHVIDNYSAPTVARRIDLVSTTDGKTANMHAAANPWEGYNVPQIRVGTIKAADGVTDLYYRLVLPVDFDLNKKYPAVVYVYGGPHAHNIDASFNWGVRGWDIWMAQQGYVMFCLDNRGSEHRGLAFEQATFRNLGVEEMKDQLCGVQFLKDLPYVDADRLGVHGWSFGGFMTSSLMCLDKEVKDSTRNSLWDGEGSPFKVGVAGGPVIDWRFYEVMYGERYMDTPQTNPDGYRSTSLLNKAQYLKGRLMVIYGYNDPTCVPQHTLSFMRACINADTYPDLFTYPGDGHNMRGTDRIHLHNTITRYFNDHLK